MPSNALAPLKVAGIVTASGTAVAGRHNPVDATSGALSIALPTGKAEGTTLVVEKTDSSANAVTLTGSIRGSASTLPIALARESIELVADATGSWWPVAGHKTKTSIDGLISAAVAGLVKAKNLTGSAAFSHNARASRFYAGKDAVDNVTYWKTTGLATSTDFGVSQFTSQPLPAGVPDASYMSGILRWNGYIYVQAQLVTNGPVHVFRSLPPSAGTMAWTDVLTTAGNAIIVTLAGSSWGSSDYIYMAEYGNQPSGGPAIYRSADGFTWTQVLQVAGLKHFHAIAPDPYQPGHVYATGGDGLGLVMARSTDYGATWTWHVTDNGFQAVQISFSADYVYFAGDTSSVPVWVIDRAAPTVPKIASSNHHTHMPVPGGAGARGPFTDGATTSGSSTFKSSSAAFNNDDVGRFVRFLGTTISEAGEIFISTVVDAQTVTLNKTAGGTSTGNSFYVEGDRFMRGAFYGTVDPATGVYYCVANDTTSGGNRYGLFALTYVGGRLELLEVLSQAGTGAVRLHDGRLWFHQVNHALLTLAV